MSVGALGLFYGGNQVRVRGYQRGLDDWADEIAQVDTPFLRRRLPTESPFFATTFVQRARRGLHCNLCPIVEHFDLPVTPESKSATFELLASSRMRATASGTPSAGVFATAVDADARHFRIGENTLSGAPSPTTKPDFHSLFQKEADWLYPA